MKLRSIRSSLKFLAAVYLLFAAVQSGSAQGTPGDRVVTVVATDAVAAEAGPDPGVFTVTRTGGTDASLLVFYQLSGSAENGIDYQQLGNTVLIPAGSLSATVTVMPIDDKLVEGPETVGLHLVPSPTVPPIDQAYLVGEPAAAEVAIGDDDKPDTNKPPIVRLVMPSDGAVFTAPANILLVAQARDDDGEVKTVEFFAGDHSLGIRTNLPVLNPLGPFILPWSNVPAGEYTLTAKATDNLGATAVSDPVKIVVKAGPVFPIVNIEATDPKASEIAVVPPGLGMPQRIDPGTFTVWRCGNTTDPLEVHYRIGGTAQNGVDYIEIPNVVTIPAGSCFTTIQIWPIDDAEVEGTETVVLTLEPNDCDPTTTPAPGCYSVGILNGATVYILDNDTKPNSPPIVKLLSPPEGAQFTAPANMVLTALARDEDGWVDKVEFFAGDRSLGVVERANLVVNDRFYLRWGDVAAGEYTLTTKATDNFGATKVSDPVHIVVRASDVAPFVFIPKGAVWKYLDNGSDQSTGWREPGFNDENWAAGPAQLGFGDGDEATVLNPGPLEHRYITYYFRRGFDPSSSSAVLNLALRLLRDDGAVVYLNGTEVFRSNMPDGPITYQTLASSTVIGDGEHVYYSAPVDAALLKNTGNVVAVEVHQAAASSSDVSFDLELLANVPPPLNQPPTVKIVAPASGDVFLAPANIVIRAEAADHDGTVKKVEFYAGDQLLGAAETAPFSLTWSNVAVGEYVLTAKATDDDGATGISDPVKIIVKARPPERTIVNIEATDPEAAEMSPLVDAAPNPGVFKVWRTGPTNIALTVFYAVGGTAENGVDYTKLTGEITLHEGSWSAEIVVDVIDDKLVEGPETVVLTLQPPICLPIEPPPPGCYRIGEHATATVIIRDDEPPPNVPPMVRIAHPHEGEVFRAPASIEIVALARDPDGWVGLVEFFANEHKIGEQRIVFIQAPPPGETQTFSLSWSNVSAGEYLLVAKATDDQGATGRSEAVKIRVVDGTPPPPVVTIHARDCFAREGTNSNGEIDTATFVVRRNDGTNTDLTVFYSVHGTADNGVDYETLSGSVVIPTGFRSARIVVTPIDDSLKEKIETVVLKLEPDPSLGPIARYTVGWPNKAAAIIVDNDAPPPPCLRLPDGLFHICLPSNDGFCFRMECSADMLNWTPLCTSVVAGGAIHFVDPEANDYPNRFYRIAPEINIDLDE